MIGVMIGLSTLEQTGSGTLRKARITQRLPRYPLRYSLPSQKGKSSSSNKAFCVSATVERDVVGSRCVSTSSGLLSIGIGESIYLVHFTTGHVDYAMPSPLISPCSFCTCPASE